MGTIPSLFAGGNGAVDSLPHFLLGRSDRTESQEDMWLVGTGPALGRLSPFHTWLSVSSSRSFRTQTFAYPESTTEREEILQGLKTRIEDITSVSLITS